jgi:hypothetical protein
MLPQQGGLLPVTLPLLLLTMQGQLSATTMKMLWLSFQQRTLCRPSAAVGLPSHLRISICVTDHSSRISKLSE